MPVHRLPVRLARFGRELLELIGGATLIGLVLVAVDLQVVRPSFQALEERQALEDNDRVAADLERELTGLAGQAGDWAEAGTAASGTVFHPRRRDPHVRADQGQG